MPVKFPCPNTIFLKAAHVQRMMAENNEIDILTNGTLAGSTAKIKTYAARKCLWQTCT